MYVFFNICSVDIKYFITNKNVLFLVGGWNKVIPFTDEAAKGSRGTAGGSKIRVADPNPGIFAVKIKI